MTETKTTLKIRKAPKFLPFIIAGALVGAISAFILNSLSSAGESILGLLLGWLTVIGGALGIVAAVFVDWLLGRSVKEVPATKLK